MKCKRRIGLLVVLVALMLMLLTACNKDYYENAIFPQLETFTAITKIKANEIEEDVTECAYSYLLSDDDAEKVIERYQKYLTNGYAFQLVNAKVKMQENAEEILHVFDEKIY